MFRALRGMAMTPMGLEMHLMLIACYTIGFLWVVLPEPGWKFAEVPLRDR